MTKHISIIKDFSTFSLFLNQMERFWCNWMCKLEGYKNVKEKQRRRRRWWAIVCFKYFGKIALDPSLVAASYLPHFGFVLTDLKLDGCANKGFTKIICIQKVKIQSLKILSSKFKFVLIHLSPNTKLFYNKHAIFSPFLYQIEQYLQCWKH